MSGRDEPDDILRALADLPADDVDPVRSGAILAGARRAIARRRRHAAWRVTLLAAACGRIVGPAAAGALSIGFIAAVVAQAVFVLQHVRTGFLWR
jgi:hypothetical protein